MEKFQCLDCDFIISSDPKELPLQCSNCKTNDPCWIQEGTNLIISYGETIQ